MPLNLLVAIDRPFPGLRTFEPDESLLFFGREQHTDELLRRLSANRFLAVVGTSGSGKSSLVRAGLLPALYQGFLAGSTTHWRIAVMKPGDTPIENLCAALDGKEALGPSDSGLRLETLRSSSLGLVEAVREAGLNAGESLLIVADQFEELFRNASDEQASADAALFVGLLLNAAERFDVPVYIVLTMRSDFLGDCAQFSGLPEALSRSQYLIPRLTREQRQQAIERPLQLAGVRIAPALVQQLLNDSADDARALGGSSIPRSGRPDPLPVLQHALMKTFEEWKRKGGTGPLELTHYRESGGVENAIDRHAESIFGDLGTKGQAWTQKIFRCLTTTENGRQIRRSTRIGRLYEIVGAAAEGQQREVYAVLERFLDKDQSLLVSNQQGLIDIPHESLIWKWNRLQEWVRCEAESAEWYTDLAGNAASWKKGEAALWRDPSLGRALGLSRTDGWNAAWADQYFPSSKQSFAEVRGFLDSSRRQQLKERWTWRIVLSVIVLLCVGLVFYVNNSREKTARLLAMEKTVKSLEADKQAAQKKADASAQQLNITERKLKGSLSPEERKKLEADAQILRDEKYKALEEVKRRADEAAGLAKAGGDLNAYNKSLADTVDRLKTSSAKTENDLADERAKNKTVQASLIKANADIERLSGELVVSRKPVVEQQKPLNKDQVAPPPSPQNCKGRVNDKDGLCYVRIPAGSFLMGCSPGDNACSEDEKPAVRVEITKAFLLGETEVTQEAFQRVMKTNPSNFKGPQRPVEGVSWHDAKNYCAAVGGRLPTEAEWEYAARARSTAARYGDPDKIAWYGNNSGKSSHDVRGKLPNAWGLYDMLGNVWEWVDGWYARKLTGGKDPRGPTKGTEIVLRGGSWVDVIADPRVSVRGGVVPAVRSSCFGFRCGWDSL